MSQNVFTAVEVAGALQRPKRSVLKALQGTAPSGTKIVFGNEAKAWSIESLPQSILSALNDAAARRKTTIDALLVSPPPFWQPRYPLSQLCEEAIGRASMVKRAF